MRLAGVAASALIEREEPREGSVAQFLLVHGAFHGGWCWERVAQRLERMGHQVFAPSLTGLAERAGFLTADVDLHTHIRDVVDVIEKRGLTDVVLCGHSYGGMVITGVADRVPERLKALVYLDAILPPDGWSCAQVLGRDVGQDLSMAPPRATYFGLSGADAARVDERMSPHPTATFRTPLKREGGVERIGRRHYVLASRYKRTIHFHEVYAACRKDPAWEATALNGGHDLMIELPDEVVAILVAAAT